jgi:hypothetical protein
MISLLVRMLRRDRCPICGTPLMDDGKCFDSRHR